MTRKVSKESVHYRHARGKQQCGNCGMFQAPAGCDLVKGFIWFGDVCDRWIKKVKRKLQ
jgi:hypothetical protein